MRSDDPYSIFGGKSRGISSAVCAACRLLHVDRLMCRAVFLAFAMAGGHAATEPIIIRGEQVPQLLGRPIVNLRLCGRRGRAIPFQVDEITKDGEYVCDKGSAANSDSGNGLLDSIDEIVFLREDCPSCGETTAIDSVFGDFAVGRFHRLTVDTGGLCRVAYLTDDASIPLSPVHYITYDHAQQMLYTPWYFARFGAERFHFVRASIRAADGKSWINLTKELRIKIFLGALWGILPIRYTEESLICFVERYKAGPVRLIRRGDFHLRMGPGIKGSHAALNQICYPHLVRVPVVFNLPVRFKHFIREAWLEMSPVIDSAGSQFTFSIPRSPCTVAERIGGDVRIDTLIPCPPDRYLFTLLDKRQGFGWMLHTNLPNIFENGSGFLFRRPSSRDGSADCGYRLVIHDIPKGRYEITNWVLFTHGSISDIDSAYQGITRPALIHTKYGVSKNRLAVHETERPTPPKSP